MESLVAVIFCLMIYDYLADTLNELREVNKITDNRKKDYNGRIMIASNLSALSSVVMTVISLWLFMPYADNVTVGISNVYLRFFAFNFIVNIASAVIMTIVGLYARHKIEADFGFNKASWKTTAIDLIKENTISLTITAIVSCVMIHMYTNYEYGWLYYWAFCAVFFVGFQNIAPAIISWQMKFVPINVRDIELSIFEYMDSIGMKVSKIQMSKDSDRTTHANAFFIGHGMDTRIVLSDNLFSGNYTKEEILAIVAHEAGHRNGNHIVKNIALSVIWIGIVSYTLNVILRMDEAYRYFGVSKGIWSAGIMMGFFLSPIQNFWELFKSYVSRGHEYEADRFAANTASASGLISALDKMLTEGLSNQDNESWYSSIWRDHPSNKQRANALK